ncbi:MAG: MATE family efflux transporter [Bacteroidota bacterium]|nr:MATE family efflux transporter [Bacteroidota bacterium]
MTNTSERPDNTTSIGRDILRALKGDHLDYTTGSLWRAILVLSVPMVLEMLMQSVFEIVDIFFVGKLGSEAVAAVGLTASLIIIVFAIGLGLSMAATAMVARRIGEKDPDGAARSAWQAIVLTVAFAIPAGVAGAVYAPDLLGLMGATPAVRDIGSGYAAVMLGSNLVILLLFLFNAIFRGAGDASAAMKALWLANILNIALDPILIFGWGPIPAMGVTGAAWATAIGRGIGVAYQIWLLTTGKTRVHLLRKHMKLDSSVQRTMIKIAGPGMLQYLVGTASWLAVMRLMAGFGSDALAGYTVAIRVIIFALLPSWGISNAAATLVGQNLGAKQPDRAERSVWYATGLDMAFLGLMGAFFWIFAPETVAVFIASEGAREVGIQSMRILTVIYPVWAIGMVTVQSFNGAGDTTTPTWIHFFCFWVLQLPLAWVMAHPWGMGTRGVFLAIAAAQVVAALVCAHLFRKGTWKHISV